MPPERRTLPIVAGPSQPPVFDKVAVVGLGLIGGSIALAAREAWPGGLVIGVDDKMVLEQAMRRHAIDVAADDLVVISEADLVVLAAPLSESLELLESLSDHLTGAALVTDVAGAKRRIVDRARALPSRLRFVGGHPLAGGPRRGFEHARADLFRDRPWLLTPAGDGAADAVERLAAFVTGIGAQPRILEPAQHDRLVADLSQLPQLTASALMSVVGPRLAPKGLELAGRGLREMTWLASAPADTWRDVCAANADCIAESLDQLIATLQALRADLDSGEALERVFDAANEARAELLDASPPDK